MCLVRQVPIFFMYLFTSCASSPNFLCIYVRHVRPVMGLFEGHEKELKVGLFEGHENFYVYMYVMFVQPQFFSKYLILVTSKIRWRFIQIL